MTVFEAEVGGDGVVVARGTPYKLREGWTLERVQAEAARSAEGKPWRCRVKHRREVIGDLFIPEDPIEAMLALIPRNDKLTRCKRCGEVAERGLA